MYTILDFVVIKEEIMIELIDKRATISALGEEPYVWNDEEWELADRDRWRMDVAVVEDAPTIQTCEDTVSRQAAIDALWKALYKYEDKTEKQFQDSDELDADDWFVHRIFVQNMSDIDRQTILELPSVQPERKKGKWLLSDEQRREDTENGNYLFFCSNCLRSDIHAKTQEVPFCWWCGCDMRGEHE